MVTGSENRARRLGRALARVSSVSRGTRGRKGEGLASQRGGNEGMNGRRGRGRHGGDRDLGRGIWERRLRPLIERRDRGIV